MPIIPKQQGALDALLEQASRLSNMERGCSGGPNTEPTPPTIGDEPNSAGDLPTDPDTGTPAPPPDPAVVADMKLEIIPRGIGTKRKSGNLAYPDGGLYPLYGVKKANYLQGFGVNQTTWVAQRVQIEARVRTRVVRQVANGAWSTIFHLPPGWWPTFEIAAEALTELGGDGDVGLTLPIRVTTDGHVQVRGPFHHPQTAPDGPGPAVQALDLRGITFNAGGGACPGVPADDPTAAGDGRAWAFCSGDPALAPGEDPYGGGGGGIGDWQSIPGAALIALRDLGASNLEGVGPVGSFVGFVSGSFSDVDVDHVSGGTGTVTSVVVGGPEGKTHTMQGIASLNTSSGAGYVYVPCVVGFSTTDGSVWLQAFCDGSIDVASVDLTAQGIGTYFG